MKPEISGVAFSSERNAGSCTVLGFSFIRGQEAEAVANLLASLKIGSEVSVSDPAAGDCSLEIRRTKIGLEAKRGCHGAYGTWRPATQQEATAWLLPGALHASKTAKPGFGGTLTQYGENHG